MFPTDTNAVELYTAIEIEDKPTDTSRSIIQI